MRGQFGLAESARLYARALLASGANVSIVDIDLGLPHGWDDQSLESYIGRDAPHGISIIFVNPDYLEEALEKIGRARLERHYIIGCWFWELEDVPRAWIPHIDRVDEIMVASEFVERAFRKVTDKPILRVPLPVTTLQSSGLERADFGLPEGAFVFLCTFDFHSWLERKNPFSVLEAFKKAFPAEKNDVFLLVKTSNGHLHTETMLELLNAAATDRRIVVRDQVIDACHLQALQRCCDAYISLHRAEGFGLGLAECMALGKPVIATGWSGNLEFMDADNSRLVDYTLVPVLEGQYPHASGAVWAEADTDMAAMHMRELAGSRAAAADLGERGRRAVQATLAPGRAAERIMRRCAEIEAMRGRMEVSQGPASDARGSAAATGDGGRL
jgi:glycosyltransferase involved in cell wall biosynthesis